MRRAASGSSILLGITVTGWALLSSAAAQSRPVVIAILPFDDRGSFGQEKEVFRALQLGIPATIASELGGHSELRLVDPAQVARELRREQLQPDARLDAATASRVGKQVGARYAVTGNFADFYGRFRLDARIVDTETAQIVKVVSNDDPRLQDRADLYRIIQAVAHKVLAQASPSALRGGAADAQTRPIPTEAITQYSLGLLQESRGEKSRAREHYEHALAAFPDYSAAREGARRARGP